MIVYCPYCSKTKTVAIVCNDTIAPKNSTYAVRCNQNKLKNKDAILSNWNIHYTKDYDGSVIKRKTYDRYCLECHKPFYYMSNLIVGDNERDNNLISYRKYGNEETHSMPMQEFVEFVKKEVKNR